MQFSGAPHFRCQNSCPSLIDTDGSGETGENWHFVRAWNIIAPFSAAEQETRLSSYVIGQTLGVKFYEAHFF